jgi:hypothetical protein
MSPKISSQASVIKEVKLFFLKREKKNNKIYKKKLYF